MLISIFIYTYTHNSLLFLLFILELSHDEGVGSRRPIVNICMYIIYVINIITFIYDLDLNFTFYKSIFSNNKT